MPKFTHSLCKVYHLFTKINGVTKFKGTERDITWRLLRVAFISFRDVSGVSPIFGTLSSIFRLQTGDSANIAMNGKSKLATGPTFYGKHLCPWMIFVQRLLQFQNKRHWQLRQNEHRILNLL